MYSRRVGFIKVYTANSIWAPGCCVHKRSDSISTLRLSPLPLLLLPLLLLLSVGRHTRVRNTHARTTYVYIDTHTHTQARERGFRAVLYCTRRFGEWFVVMRLIRPFFPPCPNVYIPRLPNQTPTNQTPPGLETDRRNFIRSIFATSSSRPSAPFLIRNVAVLHPTDYRTFCVNYTFCFYLFCPVFFIECNPKCCPARWRSIIRIYNGRRTYVDGKL